MSCVQDTSKKCKSLKDISFWGLYFLANRYLVLVVPIWSYPEGDNGKPAYYEYAYRQIMKGTINSRKRKTPNIIFSATDKK